MEFGVSEVLPNYSGGLGVLAGDHLKAASDLGVPLIGVGLLYRSGYFRQSLSLDGWQLEHYPVLDPQGLPLQLLDRRRRASRCSSRSRCPAGACCSARVWQAAVGRVPLLLLDSDIEENDPDLRGVTDRLYGGDQDHRIRQEILVGIGGVRAVRAYCARHRAPGARGLPHQRGPRGLPGPGAHPRAAATADGPRLRRGAGRRARRHRLHHPHPGAGRHRPVPASTWSATTSRRDGDRCCPACRPTACSRSAPRTNPNMFNMAHMGLRLAQRANGVVEAARRGLARHVRRRCGAASTPTRCRSARSPTACTATPGRPREVTALLGARAGAAGALAGRVSDDARSGSCATRAARAAGRRGAPPGARGLAAARRVAARSWAGPTTSSTRTCSPSASPGACRPTSGSR